MTRFKKILCFLLAIFLVLGNGAVWVRAADTESEDPLAARDPKDATAPVEISEVPGPDAESELEAALSELPSGSPAEPSEPEADAEPPEPPATEPENEVVPSTAVRNNIPLYYQTDYPETMYGCGSIATSGCSITSLAMVATYLTGHEYLPDELARYFGGTAENNIARLENGIDAMRLPCRKAENCWETINAVKAGKVAIVLMNANSIFTDSQHFIVLTGVTEDGTILINDPYQPNYEKWDLMQGFENGFADGQLVCGYSGGWIFDKCEMPEEPFLYSEPEPVRGDPRYPDITLSLAEKQLLARLIWVEARGESLEGQQAVAEVILNRMASEDFPDSLTAVIYADGQFPSAELLDQAEPYQAQYEAIESAIYGPYVLPQDVMFYATYPVNDSLWGQLGGHTFCYGY